MPPGLHSDEASFNWLKLDTRSRLQPLFPQWRVLTNVWELEPLVRKLKGLARRIVLFGSAAEGRDDEESDLDVYIETRAPNEVEALLREQVYGGCLQALVCWPQRRTGTAALRHALAA